MYQRGSQTSTPRSLPGGSPIGSSHRPSFQLSGSSAPASSVQPRYSIAGTATTASNHSGGNSLRSREVITLPADRLSSDAAVSDPARANMTPMAGSRIDSHGQPNRW